MEMTNVTTESSVMSYLREVLMHSTSKNVTFSWYDYILFSVMLFVSSLIGIYFGCFGKGQNTESEYLLGGRQMKVIPIAVSLTASHISGITLLAIPAEVYKFGATTMLSSLAMCITAIVAIFIYLPVFFKLEITSTYEYLERRFDNKCRMLASFLFALNMLLYLPIVIYIPALAFSAATGLNIHVITPVVCGICIFYTTIGGLKAVVWTDTIQFTGTLASLAAVFYLGLKSVGGFANMWQIATKGGRTDLFNMTLDVTSRDTFWPMVCGVTTTWIALTCTNQGCVQKFLSLPTLRGANLSVILYCIGCNVILLSCIIIGLIMYAYYEHCDPFTNGEVQKSDQLLPYYVMDVGSKIPGLSGLFIAGVFCAGLSTLSAHLNCLAGTLYEDFISKMIKLDEGTKTKVIKLLVVLTGVICTGMVFIIEKLGQIFLLQVSLSSITVAPMLGLFTLGVLCPFVGKKAAFYGTLTGLLFTTCLVGTAQYYKSQGYITYEPKPISTDNCGTSDYELMWRYGDDINQTELYENPTTQAYQTTILNNSYIMDVTNGNGTEIPINEPTKKDWQPFILFRVSTLYYGAIGFLITMISGFVASYFESEKEDVDLDLITPAIHFLIPKRKTHYKYSSIEKSIHIFAYTKEPDSKI